MAIERPQWSGDHQKEQPDAPGEWLFVGAVAMLHLGESVDHQHSTVFFREPARFQVIKNGDALEVADTSGKLIFDNCHWLGWWVKAE